MTTDPTPSAVPVETGRMRLAPERFYEAAAVAWASVQGDEIDAMDDQLRAAVGAVLDLVAEPPAPGMVDVDSPATDKALICHGGMWAIRQRNGIYLRIGADVASAVCVAVDAARRAERALIADELLAWAWEADEPVKRQLRAASLRIAPEATEDEMRHALAGLLAGMKGRNHA